MFSAHTKKTGQQARARRGVWPYSYYSSSLCVCMCVYICIYIIFIYVCRVISEPIRKRELIYECRQFASFIFQRV